MFFFPEDTSDVRAGIDQPGHCLLIKCFQTKLPFWMIKNGARCYYEVSSFLLHTTFTGCCGTHTHIYTVKRNKSTPVRRRLNLTWNGLGSRTVTISGAMQWSPSTREPRIATFYCKIVSLKAQVSIILIYT